jgi:predicted phage tail protein
MLTKLRLYGDLAEFIGHKEFDIHANTIGKAVSFLIHNFPQAEAYISKRDYTVLVNNIEIDETQLHDLTGTQEIKFVPVISGAGDGFKKIIGGVALVGLAIATGGVSLSATGISFSAGTLGTIGIGKYAVAGLTYIGAGLALQGVSELLYPLPDAPDLEGDPRVSFSFSGLQNTSRAGTPIPICYGEVLTGSVVISGDITTDEVEK